MTEKVGRKRPFKAEADSLLTKYLDSRDASLLTEYFGSMGPRISIAQDVNRKRV